MKLTLDNWLDGFSKRLRALSRLGPLGPEPGKGRVMPESEHRPPVHFTIDGKPYTVDDPEQTASRLLQLSGFDAAQYDIAEVRPGQQPKRYSGEEPVRVHEGEEFITIRHSAPVE